MTTLLAPARRTEVLAAVPTVPAVPAAIDLATLFTEQHNRLVQLARTIVHCPHAAEDVVQDAMLAAMKALGAFEGRAAAATWLHRIVVNAALMHLRRGRSRPEQGHADLDVTMVGPAEDPAAAAERADACERLRDCLDELSPLHRNVVELRDIQGLSTATVAASLGISENAAKIRLHRARRSLRDAFEARAGGTRTQRSTPTRVVALPRRAATDTRIAG